MLLHWANVAQLDRFVVIAMQKGLLDVHLLLDSLVSLIAAVLSQSHSFTSHKVHSYVLLVTGSVLLERQHDWNQFFVT